ncbi:MAG: ECF transporter S component [Sedimentibacter sp.]|uniref:ECF transporter S component n=1 Tax=Sedimentibacter sp. TaxID=1960295 RepID=UPI0029826BCA|nr:ECF transporter S component [Sedimentibacter sp.]MDW5298568.1 ECF transporter S component [Sedimentibacter sp.]
MKDNIKKYSIYKIAVIGLMAAMVFIATNFRIEIPTPLGKTMLHLGNVMCILSGLLFGGTIGGLAAGFGSAIFDLFDPAFAPEFWITFIMKFAMGFIAGKISHMKGYNGENRKVNIIAAIIGAATYVVLYISKTIILQYVVLNSNWEAVIAVAGTKFIVSSVNAVIAVIASLALSLTIRPALKSAGVFNKINK